MSVTEAPAELLDLDQGPVLGLVERVNSDRIEVAMNDFVMARSVSVSDLVAIPAGSGFLVGIVEALALVDGTSAQNGNGNGNGSGTGNGHGYGEHRHAADDETAGADSHDAPAGGEKRQVALQVMPAGTVHPSKSGGSFRVGAAAYPNIGASCHLVEGERFERFMALLGADVAPDERLVLGHFVADEKSTAVADGNKLFQRHLAILGNSGAGKSWTVGLLLERASKLSHANVIVLDMHGEYAPLGEAADDREPAVRGMRIAGPGDLLYAGADVLHLPYWLLELDELLSLVINEGDPNAADHRLCLTDRVQTLKRSALAELGRGDAVATATADSPVPYKIEELIRWLKTDDTEIIVRQPSGRVDPGPFNGKLGGLIARFEARMADPRYGFIFHPPHQTGSSDWLAETATRLLEAGPGDVGLKSIDFSEVPAPILPMVAGVLARLIYNVQFWMDPDDRTPVCMVCDEAHLYLPARENPTPVQRVALTAFEAIAKEGRKYGVCMTVVSQRPSDVSRTILSQCNNYIILRLTNDQDQAVIRHLVPATLSSLTGVLPMLDVGEAVVIGDAILLPMRIRIDAPEAKPASVTMPYWKWWSERPSNSAGIAVGVEAMRNQWRGEF